MGRVRLDTDANASNASNAMASEDPKFTAVKLCGSLWASHSHDWFLQGAILAILAASAARNACAAANAGKVSPDAMGTHPLSSTNMTS